MCVNQGFGKGHIENGFGKGHILKGYVCKRCSAQKPLDQALDIGSDGANRWQAQPKNGNNHRNDSKMCKTKPVVSEAWAELSPPPRKERSRRNEEELGGGGGVQVRRGKNPRQGESRQDKDKTDSTTTNKQDPQDTPAGRRIFLEHVFHFRQCLYKLFDRLPCYCSGLGEEPNFFVRTYRAKAVLI